MPKKILPLILILTTVAGGAFFRFYHRQLPHFDLAAREEIYANEKSRIRKEILKKYPDVHAVTIDKLAQELFKEKLKAEQAEIGAGIRQRAQEMKDKYRDDQGRIYLVGLDSYHWLRLLKNLIEKGHVGDRVVGGVEMDDLLGSPLDSAAKKNIHIWLGFLFYKAAALFNKNVSLTAVVFYAWVPLVLALAFFSFYLARALGANALGAFFASVFIHLSPFLASRDAGEWFDTDIYNVLLPLLAFGIFVYAFREKKHLRRTLLSALAGLSLAFYAATWRGWWFIFDIMLVSGLLFVLNQKLSQQETGVPDQAIKTNLLTLGLFFAFSSFFVLVVNGFSVWKDFVSEPLRLATVLKVTPQSLWPNVYLTVAELGPIAPFEVVQLLGGGFLFFTALSGLIYIFLFDRGSRDGRFGFGLWCLVLWVLSTYYSALEAFRFVLLLVVPVGLAFGLAISRLYRLLDDLLKKYTKEKTAFFVRCAAVAFLSAPILFYVFDNCKKLMVLTPQMDDTWHNVLTKIKKETPPDAVINSWWDFGHWFKAVAERRVLYDGMTQNTPYAYWIASALLTDKEEEAVGILRMVNGSDNKAAEWLQKREGKDLAAAAEMLKAVSVMTKSEAQAYLSARISRQGAEEILSYLFAADLPQVYFIASYDMPTKIGPISYIGNWDFKKVDMWFKSRELSRGEFLSYLASRYGYSAETARQKVLEISLLRDSEAKAWFSRKMYYYSRPSPARQMGQLLFFENGLVVNLADHSAYVVSEYEERRGVPKSLIFLEGGSLQEELQKDADLEFSALLIKEGEKYKSILVDADVAKSMLVRLYFLKGEGLKFFNLWHREEDDKGNAIYVYEMLWPPEK